jgi:CRP-like cAMP-binding protein
MDLKDYRVFQNLNPTQINNFVSACTERQLKAGEPLIVQGQRGTEVFFLLEGRLRVFLPERPRLQDLAELEAPAVVGEMEFLTEQPRTASVEAIDDAKCLAIQFSTLRTRVSHGDVATLKIIHNIAVVLANRLSATVTKLAELEKGETPRSEDLIEFRQKLFSDWSF